MSFSHVLSDIYAILSIPTTSQGKTVILDSSLPVIPFIQSISRSFKIQSDLTTPHHHHCHHYGSSQHHPSCALLHWFLTWSPHSCILNKAALWPWFSSAHSWRDFLAWKKLKSLRGLEGPGLTLLSPPTTGLISQPSSHKVSGLAPALPGSLPGCSSLPILYTCRSLCLECLPLT